MIEKGRDYYFEKRGPSPLFFYQTGSRVVICFIYLNVGLAKRGLVMATLGLLRVKCASCDIKQ